MNQKTILILFLIASLCVGFYFYINKIKSGTTTQTEIARLVEYSGQVTLNESSRVNSPRSVKNLDSLSTGENSDALLIFPSGAQLRIFENTRLSLSREMRQVVIVLPQGDIQFEEFPPDSEPILISKNNKRYSARDFEFEYKKRADYKKTEKDLSQEAIQSTLNSHKQDFYRCYLKALQKTPGLTGQATMQFQIERSGKVIRPQLNLQMNLQQQLDKELELCLVEVLGRIQFKSFTGEPVTATFPIKFE